MSSVFERLNYSFDDTKYGDCIYLSPEAQNFLNSSPVQIKTWQKNEMANGNIITTKYFKNPVLNVSNAVATNAQSLASAISGITNYDNTVQSALFLSESANLVIEIESFKKHTSNVSGNTTSTQTVLGDGATIIDYPDYQKAVSLGQQLLQILNATDSVQNASPLLGSMTSLFTTSDIEEIAPDIYGDISIVTHSIRSSTDPELGTIYTSNLTSTQVNTIISHIQAANAIFGGRREHDWNFYRTGVEIVNDYFKVDSLSRVGNTQNYLINNLIGTEEYIGNLSANT